MRAPRNTPLTGPAFACGGRVQLRHVLAALDVSALQSIRLSCSAGTGLGFAASDLHCPQDCHCRFGFLHTLRACYRQLRDIRELCLLTSLHHSLRPAGVLPRAVRLGYSRFGSAWPIACKAFLLHAPKMGLCGNHHTVPPMCLTPRADTMLVSFAHRIHAGIRRDYAGKKPL
jgi:hypothetical protein